MRYFTFILFIFFSACSTAQVKNIAGTYLDVKSGTQVIFHEDSTFQYVSIGQHPIFYRWEKLSEQGLFTIAGDTIILNPTLEKKSFVESDLKEEEIKGESKLLLTFNHIKRLYDANGKIIKADTLQIDRLDYCFNTFKKKRQVRVASHRTTRCTFAGYIPPEIITTDRTIFIEKPSEALSDIFIGCFELQGIKKFMIKNEQSNHLTLNVYSNYYEDGEIRQVRFLIKNKNNLYINQKENGEFEKDNIWSGATAKLQRQTKKMSDLK